MQNIDALAADLASKYPGGRIGVIEIGWPCQISIRAPKDGLDTPVAIIKGEYQDLNDFYHAFNHAKGAA